MPHQKAKAALAVALVLLMSAPLVMAQQSFNWEYMNSDASGTNFSPQNQITASNVGSLSVKWVFALPAASPVPGLNVTGEGAIAPPLLVDGVVYLLTNDLHVYAIDSADGNVIWSYRGSVNRTGLPLGYLLGHMHGINYYRGDIWVSLPDCTVVGLDAGTGRVVQRITGICAGIPGNAGLYATRGTAPVFFGDVMMVGSSVSEGTDAGRGFVAGYNITDGSLLWRWYVTPPAGGAPTWDASTCAAPCHGNVPPYPGDWGTLGYNGTNTLAGGGTGWGQFAVDGRTGMVYLSTSQPSPDWNATYRPGPDLYSDSIVALNATTGKMAWFFQTTPHDLYDFDCGWNVALGNVTVGGRQQEAVFKACKNGFVYALNATNGSLIWYFDPPTVARSDTGNAAYVQTGTYNATQGWAGSGAPFLQCPGVYGGIEADIGFGYGKVFVATQNICAEVQPAPVGTFGSNQWGVSSIVPQLFNDNTTIYALDASTGRVVWSYFLQGMPYRGGLTVSGGMVFAGALDGNVYALNAETGQLVTKVRVGPSLYEAPVFGSSTTGGVLMLQLVSSSNYRSSGQGVPGVLMAYGLPPSPPPPYLQLAAAAALGAAATAYVVRRRGGPRRAAVSASACRP